jgi:hypothetical protein
MHAAKREFLTFAEKTMMKKLSCVVLLMTLISAANAAILSTVQPQGDGHSGKARYGWGFGWENTGFDGGATTNWAGHWYDAPYGGSSDVYMQISLAGIPAGATLQQAYLNIYVTECSGSGGQIYHRTDSSTATGQASQQLGGNVKITDISAPVGWLSIDVTDYIQSDVDRGYSWAVFSLPQKGYSSLCFSSGETENAAYLSMVIPEPATLVILGLGSLGLLRRKK